MRGAVVGASLVLAACVSTMEPEGPTRNELARLITPSGGLTPALRTVQCDFIAEEGSEWSCRYEERSMNGNWVGLSAMVARDGGRWVLIDGICTADQALADRGRCPR